MRLRVLFSLLVAAGAVVVAAPSCSNGGEGDRCSHLGDNNGNNDCQNGLVCKCAAGACSSAACPNGCVPAANTTDLCCPPDPKAATTAVCSSASNPLGGDAGPPTCEGDACVDAPMTDAPEDCPIDGPTTDSPMDTSVDSPADAPMDAPMDAPDSPTG